MRRHRRMVVKRMSQDLEYDPVLAWMLVVLYARWCVIIGALLVNL